MLAADLAALAQHELCVTLLHHQSKGDSCEVGRLCGCCWRVATLALLPASSLASLGFCCLVGQVAGQTLALVTWGMCDAVCMAAVGLLSALV